MSTRHISFRGARWEVLEAPRVAGRADAATSLYFLSRAGTRRVDDFPEDWETLSTRELTAMCAAARTLHERSAFADVASAASTASVASPGTLRA